MDISRAAPSCPAFAEPEAAQLNDAMKRSNNQAYTVFPSQATVVYYGKRHVIPSPLDQLRFESAKAAQNASLGDSRTTGDQQDLI